jgi:hypothetical protein
VLADDLGGELRRGIRIRRVIVTTLLDNAFTSLLRQPARGKASSGAEHPRRSGDCGSYRITTGRMSALRPRDLALAVVSWVGKLAKRTVHAVLHLGWIPDESGAYHGQLAVLVKPNGLFGKACMAAIKPFRHLFGVSGGHVVDGA